MQLMLALKLLVLSLIRGNVMKNKIYQHYKGNFYEVLEFGLHSETLEVMVIYRSLKDGKIWVRPISMWDEEVIVNGEKVKRFTYIKDKEAN